MISVVVGGVGGVGGVWGMRPRARGPGPCNAMFLYIFIYSCVSGLCARFPQNKMSYHSMDGFFIQWGGGRRGGFTNPKLVRHRPPLGRY
jgi:hypothetical protein